MKLPQHIIEAMAMACARDAGPGWVYGIEAALSVLAAHGYCVVPRVATKKMLLAGIHHDNIGDMQGRYKAMLAAVGE